MRVFIYSLLVLGMTPLGSLPLYTQTTTYSTNARDISQRDQRILIKIEQKLRQKHFPNLEDIQITVENGRVVFNGLVPTEEDRQKAGWLASTVTGVRQVDNHLRVKDQATREQRKNLQLMQQGQMKNY